MKKYIFKLMPASIYEAPALESWFSEQSKKRLFLESANWIFAVFSKDKPQKTAYHLEVITGQDAILPTEILESYTAFGWNYVTCMSGLYHVFANPEEAPAELHTDPIVQALAYEKIEQRVNSSLCTTVILMVYLLLVNWLTIKQGCFTLTAMVEQNLFPFFLADLLLIVLFFLGRLFPCLQIRNQLKALQNGSFPTEKIGKKRRLHSGYCHIGVALCLCVMVYYTCNMTQYISPEEASAFQGKVPIVTLEEIEGLPPVYPINYSNSKNFPEQRDYLYWEDHSLLAPKQVILRQDEERPVRDTDNPAYLWMMYAEVAFSPLAEPYFQSQIKEILPEDAIPVDIPQLSIEIDEAKIYQHPGNTYLFLRNGKETLCIHHRGTGDLLPYLEQFASFLQGENTLSFLNEA